MLWRNVRRGSRETQVLGSPKMPHANVGHLQAMQGVESVPTGMAPPRRGCSGWMSTPQLFLPYYASSTSRSHAPSTQGSDYGGVAEAARMYPKRSVTVPIRYTRKKRLRGLRYPPSIQMSVLIVEPASQLALSPRFLRSRRSLQNGSSPSRSMPTSSKERIEKMSRTKGFALFS